MKILLAPNAFKESLSAIEVADALEAGIRADRPDVTVEKVPLADGGDGTLEVLASFWRGSILRLKSVDPLFREIEVPVGFDEGGETAVIEMARVSGLALLQDEEKNPYQTSTLGLGILIVEVARIGARRIYLGIGGSATVDGGIGMGVGLGFRHSDSKGSAVLPRGGNLLAIERIAPPTQAPWVDHVEVEVLSDVTNPLCGERGAARVFGPQKGASAEQVEFLEKGLHHLSELWKRDLGKDVACVPGSGAAGGVGAGAMVYLNARLVSGAEKMLEITGLPSKISACDLVVTGEGHLDRSSLEGKLPGKVAQIAKGLGVPCIGVFGLLEAEAEDSLREVGFTQLIPIAPEGTLLKEKKRRARDFLEETGKRIGRRLV